MISPDKNLNTNDLDLLAFRYIANEMAMDERASFECRLADDQAACEAVAAAVEMAQALALTVGELDVSIVPASVIADQREHRLSWLRPAAWMSAGAAACLIAVLVSQLISPNGNRLLTKSAKSQAESRADKLALVWSQIRQPEGTDDAKADDTKTDIDSSPADDGENTASDTLVSTTANTPSWIAAAISGLSETKKTNRDADDDIEEL